MIKPQVTLETSIRYIKGIGPKRAETFCSLGVETIQDLLFYFPRRYEDRSHFRNISEYPIGEQVTIKGVVLKKHLRPTRRMKIVEVVIDDGTGKVSCLFFNQPYLTHTFQEGQEVIVYGKLELYKKRLQINSPEYEIIKGDEDEMIHSGRIVPVYPLTEGLTHRAVRTAIKTLIENHTNLIEEVLPKEIIEKHTLMSRREAIATLHFPETDELLNKARFRIVFEEFFLFECTVARKIKDRAAQPNVFQITDASHLVHAFSKELPFLLTAAQQQVIKEIEHDFERTYPMTRLLQGDVGSGKTLVSACALFLMAQSGYQGAFMVPTEVLAEQHFRTIEPLFEKLGVSLCLLTSSTGKKEKKELLDALRTGEISVVIGTHSLIQEGVTFQKLGFVVIDEQHKFGVRQRAQLVKQEERPHVLVMTATPIPRTLGMTVYGDLDISTLTELPFGKREVKTFWITKQKEAEMFAFVKKKLDAGDQAYIVFPLIEETEKSDLQAACDEYERLRQGVFKDSRVGLIHGRLGRDEKTQVMDAFRAGTIQLLVSTTVIEVGVDNQNASIVIIEHAERFGLSQLHQMRGRVGRGRKESFCFLVGNPTTDTGKKRLRLMTKTNDGFRIAEEDLYLRGPGDFLGTRQSGLPEFHVADIVRDAAILRVAKKDAFAFVENVV